MLPQPFRSADFIRPLFKIALFAVAPLLIALFEAAFEFLLGPDGVKSEVGKLMVLLLVSLQICAGFFMIPAFLVVIMQAVYDRYIGRREILALVMVSVFVVAGYVAGIILLASWDTPP
ncbi:hypothetical protein [Haloferula sp. BvORR071]|uniref:hypothetical protein n=1 Tax=Haloferula sp. BvORR071 TaxID=1396141 RepID=UPI002240FF11|nr:hypothetical protein [Haloferula sp. BvORR071]